MNLNALKTKENVELDSNRVGGRRLWDTDVYLTTVKAAYLSQAKSGAIAINFILENENKQELSNTQYLTSGDEKGNSNTYKDSDGNDQYLPGFQLGNSLALLTAGMDIGDITPEEKVINLYNFDEKKELPTKVPMLMEIVGQKVYAAVELQEVDKRVKNDQGKYVNSGETKQQNEVVKFFREKDKMTVTEIVAKAAEATFIDVWTEKNKGQVMNRAKGASSNGATKGAPAGGAKKSGGVKSLF